MSSSIYAKPDLSKKVRYNRKVQEDKVEWEEREVDIYESADETGHDYTDIQSHEGGRQTENHPEAVQRRPFSALVVCLGVLCCLMLTGNFILFIHSTLEKGQLQETISAIAVNQSQLQDEIKQLKDKIAGKWCPEGWKRFGCSCYFKSNVKKNWDDSRHYCQDKGADLVVINNKEEQKFLTELKMDGEFWIGLKGKQISSGWVWEWEWVDGSPLTEMFTESGLPQYSQWYQSAAAYCDQEGRWTKSEYYYSHQSEYYYEKKWICEK